MYDLIIKNAKLIDETCVDIAIEQGQIAEIANSILARSKRVLDLRNKHYISAGWIDSHTHCFAHSPIYYDEPDVIGIKAGVTSVVDAGSVGALDVAEFYQLTRQAHTHVYSFLNISKIGLITQSELASMDDIDALLFEQALIKYPDFVVGIKVRMSRSVVGENGIEPLIKAKKIQKKCSLPLMIHIGNNPPDLDEIADLLTEGDIITHCFNGKPNQILDKNNNLRDSIKSAIKRGVILDIGHGGESFSFTVAERAKSLGIYPNTISSDIYAKNRLHGPVVSLANIMTKFIALNYSKKRIIDSVTVNPAQILHLKNKGLIAVGYDADLTIFDIKQQPTSLSDAHGEVRQSQEQFVPLASIVADIAKDDIHIQITQEGSKNELRISS